MHPFKILRFDLKGLEIPDSVSVTEWGIDNNHLSIKLSTEDRFVAQCESVPTIYFAPLSAEVLRLRVENKRLLAELKSTTSMLEDAEHRLGEMSDN